jgi:hypothetical protein
MPGFSFAAGEAPGTWTLDTARHLCTAPTSNLDLLDSIVLRSLQLAAIALYSYSSASGVGNVLYELTTCDVSIVLCHIPITDDRIVGIKTRLPPRIAGLVSRESERTSAPVAKLPLRHSQLPFATL